MAALESPPVPTPSSAPGPLSGAPLSRRAALAVLAAAVGGAVAGCTPERQQPRARRQEPVEPQVDPDVAVAAEALADQRAMVELIEATQRRHRGLGELLAPALATHQAHMRMLKDAVPDDVPVSPSGSPSASASPSASGSPQPGPHVPGPHVPRDQARALGRVVRAEQELRTSTKRLAFKAESGAFARVLGSMTAAAAQQAVLLSSSPAGRGPS